MALGETFAFLSTLCGSSGSWRVLSALGGSQLGSLSFMESSSSSSELLSVFFLITTDSMLYGKGQDLVLRRLTEGFSSPGCLTSPGSLRKGHSTSVVGERTSNRSCVVRIFSLNSLTSLSSQTHPLHAINGHFGVLCNWKGSQL